MSITKIRVVALDLDGVLYDGQSAARALAKSLGIEERFLGIFAAIMKNKMSFEESIVEGARLWIDIPVDGTLDSLVHTLPLRKGAVETITQLKKWGYHVGCISSGVSQFFMNPFKQRLSLDFAFSNTLGEDAGRHNGQVMHVMGGHQKAETMTKYMNDLSLSTSQLASIGDGENDIELFGVSGLSIAFNPVSEKVSKSANVSVHSSDLRDTLKYLKPKP